MKKLIMGFLILGLLFTGGYFLLENSTFVSGEGNKEKKTVLIDPGHGGMDPGMIGVNHLEEKGINLAVAEKLKACLEKMGFYVVMTRETDCGLYDEECSNKKMQDLQRRISLMKEKNPILSVSIHQNSYQDPEVKGPQVFYYTDSQEGKKLAETIQKSMNCGLKIERPRSAKGNTSYYLLKKSPGILAIVECGFLTNVQEAELLQTEGYQEKVAEFIAEGIEKYCLQFTRWLT